MRRSARLIAGSLCLASFALVPELYGQSRSPSGGSERSAWYMYFGDHPISSSWGIHLEGQYRREGFGERWEQLLIRPGVDYYVGHGITLLFGYSYIRNYPFEGGSLGNPTTTGPQPEHRIFEEFKFKHKLFGAGKQAVTLAHRFRAEQRFLGTSTAGVGVTAWNFAERARYRLTANIPFRWNTAGIRPDYLSLYDEVFVVFGPHGGNHALNQNRTYGALGWNLNESFQLEVGYLHRYMPRPNGFVGESNDGLQVAINSTAPFRRGLRKK